MHMEKKLHSIMRRLVIRFLITFTILKNITSVNVLLLLLSCCIRETLYLEGVNTRISTGSSSPSTKLSIAKNPMFRGKRRKQCVLYCTRWLRHAYVCTGMVVGKTWSIYWTCCGICMNSFWGAGTWLLQDGWTDHPAYLPYRSGVRWSWQRVWCW